MCFMNTLQANKIYRMAGVVGIRGDALNTGVTDPTDIDSCIMHTASSADAWHDIATLYYGFHALPYPGIAVACVDQSVMHTHLEPAGVMAQQILTVRERHAWMQLGLSDTRKLHWLMGRLAAKKAVWKIMSYARTDSGTVPRASEIEVLNAEDGAPYCNISNISADDLSIYISISIAHTDGMAIAAASLDATVGVDIERTDRYGSASDEKFPQMAFINDERIKIEWCTGTTPTPAAALTRIWTAKEAAGKAAGLRLGGILKHCRFIACSSDLSLVTLSVDGANSANNLNVANGESDKKHASGVESMKVDVRTVQEQGFFLALSVCPPLTC